MVRSAKYSLVMILGLIYLAGSGCDDENEPFDPGMCGCAAWDPSIQLESVDDLDRLLEYLESSSRDCAVWYEEDIVDCNITYFQEDACDEGAEQLEQELKEQQFAVSVSCICTGEC